MLTKSSQPRAHQDEDKSSRRLLLMGGSANHWGGVEAFCDRAADALERNGRWAVDRIPTCTAHLNPSTFPAYLAGMRSLWRRRRALPDVAWIQYGNLLDLTYVLLAKMMGMRVMVTPHLGIGWRSQRNPLLRWLSYTILRTADRLALISPTQEAELMLPHSVPRTMIRTFLPKQIFDDAPADAAMLPPELQLIHAGRLSAGKGTFLLVDVCARLRDAGVPFAARIIGSADQATITRLRQAVVDADLEGKVTLVEHLPVPELIKELQRSDVLVHLSEIDSYPLVVLEALASATLPLVMELAGARDMVTNYGGAVVGAGAPADDAAAWIGALDVEKLRRDRLAVASRTRADYVWSRCAAALDDALEACVA